MKVIICGAGQVGSNIARYLASENNDVTVIDQAGELIQKLSETLDVQAIVGHASEPSILEKAGAADADLLIAVTQADEVNMVACQVAHSLFDVPTKIARVRNQGYLAKHWSRLFSREHLPIDVIISPEIEVARAVRRRLSVPGAFDMIPMAEGKVQVVGVVCGPDCPIINTPLRQLTGLFPDLNIEVLAIVRGDRPIVPDSNDQMFPGDEVYFIVEAGQIARAMSAFGHEEPEARRVVIIGGGNIGLCLAEELERLHPELAVRILEANPRRARQIAQHLNRCTVLGGDGLDEEFLLEADIADAEVVVAVTEDDEVNILASLLAKRNGSGRAVTLINHATYASLAIQLGIDAVVSPRAITASSILQHVRRGRIKSVHSLRDGFAEVIEAEVLETSSLANMAIKHAKLPSGTIIGSVIRGDQVFVGRPGTVIKPHDRVVLLAGAQSVKKIEKMFAVRLEFF